MIVKIADMWQDISIARRGFNKFTEELDLMLMKRDKKLYG